MHIKYYNKEKGSKTIVYFPLLKMKIVYNSWNCKEIL